jgi:para-aminobenzoate synthetase / 4-amino-4-deoxychorismate lyase
VRKKSKKERSRSHPSRPRGAFDEMQIAQLARKRGLVLLRDGAKWKLYKDPKKILIASDVKSLHRVLSQVESHIRSGGQAAGVLRYEAGYALEPRLYPLLPRASGRLAWFGLYDKCVNFESLPGLDDGHEIAGSLIKSSKFSITRRRYGAKIEAIRRLIQAGEVYQINFTTRAKLKLNCSAWQLFAALYSRHPAPYAAFLNTGAEQIVSLSPEMFFEIEGRSISVRPMKGTAPRGKLLEDDKVAAEQLRNSEKNRAENVMIVDLMRNDLGRICRAGSVKTTSLFDVERYPSVWQMTSTVKGELLAGCTFESIVRALFPSGSVTGAPKIRAMEHIAQLEYEPRGVYTGAIGYFGKKRARFNVAIRTVELREKGGIMGVGGGITFDSSADEEWEECHWKGAFLLQSEPKFKLIETLYWDGEYRLPERHLARMRDSAEYFGFAFEGEKFRAQLQRLSEQFGAAPPQRVRVTLSSAGDFEATRTEYDAKRFGKVGISRRRVSSEDRFLFHKTTNRIVYDREFASARKRYCDDVLHFNEKDELTEAAAHNVFVVKDGVWRTPPLACGLLPGIFRAHILETCRNSREAILGLNDLKDADAVYLCNSVRGAYPVEVDWHAALRNHRARVVRRRSGVHAQKPHAAQLEGRVRVED